MLRVLKAFAWMRWRILMNSLEKTSARDAVERFSLAIEHLAPILVLVVMIPSALALAGVSAFAGYQLATGDRSFAFQGLRYLLLAGTALTILGPVFLPAADRTNPVRLLLLPISPSTLYVAQAAGTLSDPWILLLLPIVLALPLGLLAGGAVVAAVVALAAGLLAAVALVGLSALVTTIIHLVLRDRRRGELVALLLIFVLPLISVIPASLGNEIDRRTRREARALERRGEPRPAPAPRSPLARASAAALRATPTEAYAATVSAAVHDDIHSASASTVPLIGFALAIHAVGLLLFRRALAGSGTASARRTGSMQGLWARRLPLVSPQTSAVALALLRLALRTPRGRSIVLAPVLMLVVFGFLAMRSGSFDFGVFNVNRGLGLATFASSMALLSIIPIALNQFAVDGAGLTMTLLSPLTTRQLLAGKAIGSALVALLPALLCVAIAAAMFGGGSSALWLSLVIGLLATFILASPAAAVFSAMLPRAVDMNSIGRGSNAHGLSGLLGLAAFAIAALPNIALVVLASHVLDRPPLAPVLLMVWCGVAFAIARLLFVVAEKIFDTRRDNLAMLM